MDCCKAEETVQQIPNHSRDELTTKGGYLAVLQKTHSLVVWCIQTFGGDFESTKALISPLQNFHEVCLPP